jgi:hypothetical protein
MNARYRSSCPECCLKIEAGSPIARLPQFGGRYGHPGCVVRDAVPDDTDREYYGGESFADAEYSRGLNDTKAAQAMGPAGSAAREAAYAAMEAQWAREGFDG